MRGDNYHEPVMVREALEALHVQNQARYIDATLGAGGHSREILKQGGCLLGIDVDPKMLEVAKKRLKEVYPEDIRLSSVEAQSDGTCPTPFKVACGNFTNIDKIAEENGFEKVSGILFDLGISSMHLADSGRGFSFSEPNAVLDMRLDVERQGVTGSDLLNALREDQLRELFNVTMDPGSARWLSKKIVAARTINPIRTVGDFLEICDGLRIKARLNPATLPFLALRIAVNNELENLEEALPKAFELLKPGGRLVVISFHSGEDRIVKRFFRDEGARGKILTERPLLPSEEEIRKNPKARSAKMRVLEKI